MSPIRPLPFFVLLLSSSLWASACSSSSSNIRDEEGLESPWIQATPLLAQQIEDEALRLPFSHGFDRLEQIRWFASIGEPSYPTLLRLALDARDDVAAAALAALGATLDARLVGPIHALQWSDQRDQGDLGLERARTLVRLGDWSCMPVLIEGLGDERLFTRSLCLDALKEATKETHGFDPRAEESARDKAIAGWREWWLLRSGEGILPRQ